MAINLGTAYVDIVPSTARVAPELRRGLVDPASRAGDEASRSFVSRFASRLTSGIRSVVGSAFKVAAVTGGAIFGAAIVKGFSRLSAIDDARGKLTGLGNDSVATAKIMDSALESVRGTAFGLGEAATVSATAVAAGVKPGKDLTRYLKLIADTATIAGGSLEEIGSIINKTTTSGRVFTDDLNQLADRGLPVFSWLQEEYGLSAVEFRKMVESGKVDAETLRRVIEENIGGAALASGNTFRGAMANIGASLGRLGAGLLQPFFSAAKLIAPSVIAIFDELTGRVTGRIGSLNEPLLRFALWFQTLPSKVGPALEKIRKALLRLRSFIAPLVERVKELFSDKTIRAGVAGRFERLTAAGGRLGEVLKEAWPAVAGIIASLAAASAKVGVGTWDLLVAALESLSILADTVLVPALNALNGIMEDQPGLVTALVAAYVAWRAASMAATVAMAAQKAITLGMAAAQKVAAAAQWALNAAMSANPIMLVVIAIAALVAGLVWAYHNVGWFRDLVDKAFNFIKNLVGSVVEFIGNNWKTLLAILTGPIGIAVLLITKHWDTIKSGFTKVRDWIGDRIADIVKFFTDLPGKIDRLAGGMFDGISDAFRAAINFIIDGWNGLDFEIPGFKIGPVGYDGFTLGLVDIPRLHSGGLVTGRPGSEQLRILEAGEMVWSRRQTQAFFASGAPAPEGSRDGGGDINVDVDARGIQNPAEIGDLTSQVIAWKTKRLGVR